MVGWYLPFYSLVVGRSWKAEGGARPILSKFTPVFGNWTKLDKKAGHNSTKYTKHRKNFIFIQQIKTIVHNNIKLKIVLRNNLLTLRIPDGPLLVLPAFESDPAPL